MIVANSRVYIDLQSHRKIVEEKFLIDHVRPQDSRQKGEKIEERRRKIFKKMPILAKIRIKTAK